MKTLLSFMLMLFVSAARAESGLEHRDFSMTSETASQNQIVLKATPPEGHHFNVKAPMALSYEGVAKRVRPVSATEKEVRFHLVKQEARDAVVSLYLCDDKNTYCEKHTVSAKWDPTLGYQISGQPVKAVDVKAKPSSKKGPEKSLMRRHAGFLFNDPKAAFAQAKKENKPVMIAFSTIWCPSCNWMDQEVLEHPDFKKASARFVKVMLDSDLVSNYGLREQYQVKGYPTYIFANADGVEVSRVVGSRALPEFLAEVNLAWEMRKEPVSVLQAKADQGDAEAAEKLGKFYFDQDRFELARKYLVHSVKYREQYLGAEIGYWQSQGDGKEAGAKTIEWMEKAASEFPESFSSAVHMRTQLAELYETRKETSKKKETLRKLIVAGKNLAEHPEKLYGDLLGLGEVWAEVANAEEGLENLDNAKQAWKYAALEYLKESGFKEDRVNQSNAAYCLGKSGDLAGADRIYEKLQKLYPNEVSYYLKQVSLYFALKKYPEARDVVRKAYDQSYGDNRLRAVLLWAKIAKEMDLKEEAKKILGDMLKTISSYDAQLEVKNRYTQRLNDLMKGL